MGDLTRNFSRIEFECHCGCGLDDIDLDTVQALQELRDKLGLPVKVLCGCRCARHNAAVGGALHSYHTPEQGCKAVDVAVKSMTPRELSDYVEWNVTAFNTGGIGRYRGFTHLDTGPKRRW